jgi:sigma-E factor negative regulatory protein RseC
MNNIIHTGIIESKAGDKVFVSVKRSAGCMSCKAEAICFGKTKAGNVVEVVTNPGESFSEGETVELSCSTGTSRRAAMLMFLIPLILIVSVIILMTAVLKRSEAAGAIAGLSAAVLWYAALYMLRTKLNDKFVFTIRK